MTELDVEHLRSLDRQAGDAARSGHAVSDRRAIGDAGPGRSCAGGRRSAAAALALAVFPADGATVHSGTGRASGAGRVPAAGAAAAAHVGRGTVHVPSAVAGGSGDHPDFHGTGRDGQARPQWRAVLRAGEHEVSGENGLALVEEHDIVYRDMPAAGRGSGRAASRCGRTGCGGGRSCRPIRCCFVTRR